MARVSTKTRKDTFLPAEPSEMFKLLFYSALTQGRSDEGEIQFYLPPAREHAENIVERIEPIQVTTFLDEDREIE